MMKLKQFGADSSHPHLPATGLVLLSVVSTQTGAALAKGLFPTVGFQGVVSLRVGIAAILLFLFWRPSLFGYTRKAYLNIALFGLSLAAMNLLFYASISKIPLGVAVTIEFIGPLCVAVASSRRFIDILYIALAASGIALLTPIPRSHLNLLGVCFAFLAGMFWAAYILLSARVGRTTPGANGLAIAMCVAAIFLIPLGLSTAGFRLVQPLTLLAGLGVSLLSSVIPYSLELEALRRLPQGFFGLLMSIEPAVATLAGFIFLHENVTWLHAIAMIAISAAMAGATLTPHKASSLTPVADTK